MSRSRFRSLATADFIAKASSFKENSVTADEAKGAIRPVIRRWCGRGDEAIVDGRATRTSAPAVRVYGRLSSRSMFLRRTRAPTRRSALKKAQASENLAPAPATIITAKAGGVSSMRGRDSAQRIAGAVSQIVSAFFENSPENARALRPPLDFLAGATIATVSGHGPSQVFRRGSGITIFTADNGRARQDFA